MSLCVCVWARVRACACVCYLQQEVHEAGVSLHLVLKLVEDDEGSEREAPALWTNQNTDRQTDRQREKDL